ncbi:MAG TPA: hypothetical protein VG013_35555 [Gemmataceae bacterium]|jgi:hypothetical protein|nr:hypothetical protein [Gemmataceae bacterium]
MTLVRCEIFEGPRSGFKVVKVRSIEGHSEYLTIEDRFLVKQQDDYFLPVGVIGKDRQQGAVLVQLPVEADSGANRVWVSKDQLAPKADEIPA